MSCGIGKTHPLVVRLEPSSLGWNPKEKKKETFHSDSRFILVYRQKSEDEPKILVAFTIFRFELGYMDEASVYW